MLAKEKLNCDVVMEVALKAPITCTSVGICVNRDMANLLGR
jgi:hypothetical protein